MRVGKKVAAVALGTATVAGWLVTNLIKSGFEAAAQKVGNGTSPGGHTRDDFNGAAKKCEKGEDVFRKGFKKVGELWKAD